MARENEELDDVLEVDPNGVDEHDAGDEGDRGREGGEGAEGDDKQQQQKEKKPAVSPEVKEMRRALRETRLALRTTNAALETLQRERNGGGDRRQQREEEEETAPTLSVDLVEAITKGDPKAIKQAMKELGFVSEKEVERRIASTRTQIRSEIGQEAGLYKKYPELADEKSEFFRMTSKIYNDLEQDPALAKSPRLAEIAAELAEKRLGKGGEDRDGQRRGRRDRREDRDEDYGLDREFDEDDDEGDDDEERDRVERVRRQSGDRGRRSSSRRDRGGNNELDATQKLIVKKLRDAGADISEDGYRKRAEKGVRMAGMPARRPRF